MAQENGSWWAVLTAAGLMLAVILLFGLGGWIVREQPGAFRLTAVFFALLFAVPGYLLASRSASQSRAVRESTLDLWQANQGLRESEEQYRTTMDAALVGIYIVQGGLFRYVNSEILRLTGYAREEIVERLGPADVVSRAWQGLVRENEARRMAGEEGAPYELAVRRKDGSTFDAMVWSRRLLYRGRPALVGTVLDISERKRAADALRESEERFRSIFAAAPIGVMTVTPQGAILQVNPRFCRILDYREEELIGHALAELTHPEDREATRVHFAEAEAGRCQPAGYEKRYLRRDGTVVWAQVTSTWICDAAGRPLYSVGLVHDVSEAKAAEARLRENEARLHYLSHHDPMTHLPNRLLFQDRLQHALAKARRHGWQVALLFLDLDRFKTINDSLGHDVGDRLLCEVAERLRSCTRESDTVARLGGDEFFIVLEQMEDINQVAVVSRKILARLAAPVTVEEYRLHVTASIGISLFPGDGQDPERLRKAADVAMYRAKEQGGNGYHFYTPDMDARAQELLLLEGSLRQALERQELVLHYQPQFELSSGRPVGLEALVRWQHPTRGMIPPGDFISLAEESGLIVPLGEWVLRTACAQLVAWQRQGLTPPPVAVNISARQFRQGDLARTVADVLDETGLAPGLLELELTESMIMNNLEGAVFTMHELTRMGVRLAIDDFGTGYSSLSHLKRFPIDKLKIDRSFVLDVARDSNGAAIVSSIIALARGMGLKVTAEGVETDEQLAFLQGQGCEQGQGFLLGRPLPAPECEPWLR